MTTKQDLVKIKSKALRTRVWFRVLSKVERAIVDLTIKCVEKIRSPILERAVADVVGKILGALENRFLSRVEKVGRRLAENFGNIALKWGNKNASDWKCDKDFIVYLGVNSMNWDS